MGWDCGALGGGCGRLGAATGPSGAGARCLPRGLLRYIDGWYNPRRTQQGLDGLLPDEYEEA